MVGGCTDATDLNYDPAANTDDGSCASDSCSSVEFNGHTYSVVEIGDQCWFAENVRTTTYQNGDAIPAGLTDGRVGLRPFGRHAVYGEGSSPCNNYSPDIDACDEAQSLAEYGRLYNWYAVDDARGLCPSGWHVPTDGEWTDLENYISSQGFSGTEGTALKSTYGWIVAATARTTLGFRPFRAAPQRDVGLFYYAGYSGYWWSSSPSGGDAWYRYLYDSSPVVYRSDDSSTIRLLGQVS